MTIGKLIGGIFVLFLLFKVMGGGGKSDGNKRVAVAEKFGLTQVEHAAFKACERQMSGKILTLKGKGTVRSIPKDICACQSKSMAATFQDGQYDSHINVIAYLSDDPSVETLKASHLKNPENPEAQFQTLVMSAMSCVLDFQAKQDKGLEDAIIKNQKICDSSNSQVKKVCSKLRREGRI